MYDLLTEPLIEARLPGGEVRQLSLSEVLASLAASRIEAFTRLQRHQRHAWHAFLVQLAAMALHRGGMSAPPKEEATWTELLRGLTPDFPGDEPWHLVTQDLRKPAFFQSPVPEGSLSRFKGPFASPDEIDVLVTSKDHDVKMARIRHALQSHWLHTLVTLQTMEGFLGQGNYGISRMNGGFASRPCVSVVAGQGWCARFLRDLRILLDSRNRLLEAHGHFLGEGGKCLLWLDPWDGQSLLSIDRMDPYYVEICRRIRLVQESGRLMAWTTPTKKERVAAKAFKGNLGDPWTPIKVDGPSALTVGQGGFTYRLLQQVLFTREYEPSACQKVYPSDPEEGLEILTEVMARGQGKTEGLHERRVPIPAEVRALIALDEGRDRLATRARQCVEDAGTMVKAALRPALLALVQGGPDKLNMQDERPRKWVEEFDRQVNAVFFEDLWECISLEDDDARQRWQERLVSLAKEVLAEAKQSVALPASRLYRSIAASDRCFFGSVHNHFPLLHRHRKEAR